MNQAKKELGPIAWAAIIWGIVVLSALLTSCSQYRRAEKSIPYIAFHEPLRSQMIAALPPCTNDTTTVHDTTTVTELQFFNDTTYETINDTVFVTVQKVKVVEKVKTKTKYLRDIQREQHLERENAALRSEIKVLREEPKEKPKKGLPWWFWAILAAIPAYFAGKKFSVWGFLSTVVSSVTKVATTKKKDR